MRTAGPPAPPAARPPLPDFSQGTHICAICGKFGSLASLCAPRPVS